MAIGFVPSMRSAPQSGATSLVVLVIAQPIRSRFERLQRIVAGDAEVIGVADAHPARAMLHGFVHSDLVRLRADH